MPPDDEAPVGTQVSGTQAEKQLAQLSSADKARKVNDLVQYLLIQDQRKIPIKKQDIVKAVMKDHSKLFSVFIQKAKEKLRDVFGIDLIEIETQSKQKTYILTSLLDNNTDNPHQTWSDDDNAKIGLVMVVLSSIFMNGGMMKDAKLYHMLKKMGVDVDHGHELFGDVKKLLTQDLVKQGYFEYVRQPSSDPPSYDFKWGPRAEHETTKRNVLDFVCQVYENSPDYWVSQYQEVLRVEGGEEEEN